MISIIIPVLNEADTIGKLIKHLKVNTTLNNISEIIIIDGGSTDSTLEVINKTISTLDPIYLNLYLILKSERGRAIQMNLGARKAQGSILYFLHADSLPPQNFDQHIINEVKKGNPAGCFKMKFDHHHWWLQLASWLTHFKWRACRGGDQSQFITKKLFNEIGGYDEKFMIYEDNILINELYHRKQFVVIQNWIITSARLYKQKGIWRLQYHFWIIYVKRWLGASAEEMYHYYKKHIAT